MENMSSPFHQRGMFSTENTCVFITSIKLELCGLKQKRNIEPRIFAKLLKKCVYIQSHFPKYNRNKRAGGFWFLAKKQLHAQHMYIIYTVSAYIVFASEPDGTLVCPHPCKRAPRVFLLRQRVLGTRHQLSLANLCHVAGSFSPNSPLPVSQVTCGLGCEFLLNCLTLQQGK